MDHEEKKIYVKNMEEEKKQVKDYIASESEKTRSEHYEKLQKGEVFSCVLLKRASM